MKRAYLENAFENWQGDPEQWGHGKKRASMEDVIFNAFNGIFMLLIVTITLYPILNTLALSLNDGMDSLRGGIYLWPRQFTLKNYQAVFFTGTVFHAFFVSVARSMLSMVLNVFFTTMLAYTLSRKEYVFRKLITVAFVLTMYFNAGMIPHYFLIKELNLMNNFWVYIIPSLVGAFNLIVVRTYIKTIPESLIESARMDGAGDFKIFLQIILPLCKPVLATIALFVAVGSWNSWFDTFLYCSSRQELSTLQYELMKLMSFASQTNYNPAMAAGYSATGESVVNMVTPVSIRAAITVVAAAPIVFVYPFLQKHFVVGLNVGSVKD
jgi:putative aldouronate transport system permease protein